MKDAIAELVLASVVLALIILTCNAAAGLWITLAGKIGGLL
jgi:hypothetical protein